MVSIIDRKEFLRDIEPMISVIKQGRYYFATNDHGDTIEYDEDTEGIAQKILNTVIYSLQFAWPERTIRVHFEGENREIVDFHVKREPKGKFSLTLNSDKHNEEESKKFLGVFLS